MAADTQASDWLDFSDIDEDVDETADQSPAPDDDDADASETTATTADATDADDEDASDDVAPAGNTPLAETTAAVAAPTDAPSGDTPATTATPYVVKSYGKTVPLEGVTLNEQGMSIAPVSVERVKDLLQRGVAYESEAVPRLQRLERENGQLRQGRSAREAHAETIIAKIDAILDGGPEKVAEFFEDYYNNRATLKAQGILAEAEAKREEVRRDTEPDPDEYREHVLTLAQGLVTDKITEYATKAGLSSDDTKALITRYRDRAHLFVRQAPHDMPDIGVRAGDPVIHYPSLHQEASYEIELRKERQTERARAEAAEAQRAEIERKAKERQAAARNAARLGTATQQQRATNRANPKTDAAKAGGPRNMAELLADLDEDD